MDNIPALLLVEDDPRLSQLVADFLRKNGFWVQIETQGDRVIAQVKRHTPDLIVLDIGLPERDGFSICKELRTFYHKPILILTANDSDIDQVLGLELGADDYVVKPAEPRVLLARVRALLRRTQTASEKLDDISVGKLYINRQSRDASLNSTPLKLSSHEFDLLVALCENSGEILSRERLYQQIYGREYDESRFETRLRTQPRVDQKARVSSNTRQGIFAAERDLASGR
jgi:DNA-binding response OmpR family regulator